jgi:hypothetical protein
MGDRRIVKYDIMSKEDLMRFSRESKIAALALVLILGFLPILGAQSVPNPSDVLPETRDLRFPESSVSKATAGTITGDPDAFMSPVDWSSIENMESTFVLAGVDEYGLALGFAKKFGKLYLGASYSGDLIDELYRRVTNKETGTLLAGMGSSKNDNVISTAPYVFDRNDEAPSDAVAESKNDVNFILGVGVFGLRLGFSEYIRAVNYEVVAVNEFRGQDSLETSLKPNLGIGFNIPAGKVTIKPALWGAFDVHGFSSKGSYGYYDFTSGSPLGFDFYEYTVNFMEPSGGLTVDVEIAVSDTTSLSFGLEGGGAFRMYPVLRTPMPWNFFIRRLLLNLVPLLILLLLLLRMVLAELPVMRAQSPWTFVPPAPSALALAATSPSALPWRVNFRWAALLTG